MNNLRFTTDHRLHLDKQQTRALLELLRFLKSHHLVPGDEYGKRIDEWLEPLQAERERWDAETARICQRRG